MTLTRNPPPQEPHAAQSPEAQLKTIHKAIEDEIARRAAYEASGGPARDLRLLRRRIAADLVVLAKVCDRRACRRARRCRFAAAPCIAAHRGTVLSRLSVLLGFREPDRNADGRDEDLHW